MNPAGGPIKKEKGSDNCTLWIELFSLKGKIDKDNMFIDVKY
jgi:hypothetical protein